MRIPQSPLFVIFTFFCCILNASAQVGINTTNPDPSSALDIQSDNSGLLIPRMTGTQRDLIIQPANGLIFFNTDTDEIQVNINTAVAPIWESIKSSAIVNQSVKYINTDFTTNVNVFPAIDCPIYGNNMWNDNASLYSLVDSENLNISEAGRYEIVVNISLKGVTTNTRQSPEIRLEVNGSPVGSYGSTGYMRRSSGTNESSLHLREVLEIGANSNISVGIVRSGAAGTTRMRSAGTSNIYINKLL
ncbi:hypothetical protein [Dokdonia sp. Hel_I_53]|uniref:hypothetical protein n=1 Tax=Dokdonia sp. Hel_I_53 TaxID=1566287 RepID=UPI00119A0B56|nr:hypothetical protein [Dokdonia sp. Hel_I_53]TVZ53243.1 hypothetical protein OD90_2443 [Dokdonia sp. Hel_I_53]